MTACNISVLADWNHRQMMNASDHAAASITEATAAVASSALAQGMDEPWNRVVKLLVLSAVATVASVANIFVISAVLMEDHLKKRGNSPPESWQQFRTNSIRQIPFLIT